MNHSRQDNPQLEEIDIQQPVTDVDHGEGAVVKVFGVGGGGCNALQQMIKSKIRGVEYKVLNTDDQDLKHFDPEDAVPLGNGQTRGLGAGADAEVGKLAAQESREDIKEAIGDADILFITAGMGGGTGTGAAPVVAEIARDMGVLTVAVVSEPFAFEGKRRRTVATTGLDELRANADSLIVVPNENLLKSLGSDVSLVNAFAEVNNIVTNAVQSIAELITASGLINLDFADVKAVMCSMGNAIMSTGTASGENRAEKAALAAIESPLLNNINLKSARGLLANITAGPDLSIGEFQAVGDLVHGFAADEANVLIGTVLDESMGDDLRVTVVATGIESTGPNSSTTPRPKSRIEPTNDDVSVNSSESDRGGKIESASSQTDSQERVEKEDNESVDGAEQTQNPSESAGHIEPAEREEVPLTLAADSAPKNTLQTGPEEPGNQPTCGLCHNPTNMHADNCSLKTANGVVEDNDATVIHHPKHNTG